MTSSSAEKCICPAIPSKEVVKTARVRLGHDVTVGLGSIIDIGVDVGPHCQIGG